MSFIEIASLILLISLINKTGNFVSYPTQWRWTQSATHQGAFEFTKHSKVSSIAPKVGSTEFTDIALDNDFIPYYSGGKFGGKGGEFKKEEVNSGKRRWIQERGGVFREEEVNSGKRRWIQGRGGEFRKEEVNSGERRWIQTEAHLPFNQWESGFSAKYGINYYYLHI